MKTTVALLLAGLFVLASGARAETPAPAEKPAETKPAKAGKFKWYTSYKSAQKAAAEEKKPIFALFTGSDWCPYCIKLEKEVLSSKEFKAWAPNHVILFIADAKGGAANLAPENKKLMKELGGNGFPSVILVDAEGKKLGATGYTGAKPADYNKSLEGIIGAKK